MATYDISLDLSEHTTRWVSAPPWELEGRRRIDKGDANNSSSIHMSLHSGTHVDAPFHFVPGGATIDQLPLDVFLGPARVCEVDTPGRHITAEHVAALGLAGEERVLFKTRNSALLHTGAYDPDFVAFSEDAAHALASRGVRLVGLDYLSAAHADEQVPVHRAFLDNGVVLLEGVDLSQVPPGRYDLMCLPIRLHGADGAPCRAVLREL